jgi:D-arginine dehydrogenase
MLAVSFVTEAADVVIIGAGFAGAATAYHLTARGVRDVLVVEAEPRAGAHASGKNAALCFQLIADPDEARLAVEGTRVYAAPPEDLSPRSLLVRSGSLLVAEESGAAGLEESVAAARVLGVRAAMVSREEAVRRVPLLAGSSFAAALDNPEDGVVDIARLLDGYLAAARARGARVRFGEAVHAIDAEGSRVRSVTTAKATISTRCVVDAAGPWAGEVGRLAGAAPLEILPRRRHIFRAKPPQPIDGRWPFVWHADLDVYFRPEGDGILTSACDASPHPPQPPAVDDAAEADLRTKLTRAFPALGAPSVVEARACLRTFSQDESFLIGRDPQLDGFVWVAALGGHGMSTSYAVGRLAAAATRHSRRWPAKRTAGPRRRRIRRSARASRSLPGCRRRTRRRDARRPYRSTTGQAARAAPGSRADRSSTGA